MTHPARPHRPRKTKRGKILVAHTHVIAWCQFCKREIFGTPISTRNHIEKCGALHTRPGR